MNPLLRNLLSFAALILTALAFPEGPNPNEVYISDYTALGTGCPYDSTASILSPDGQALTILFSKYLVESQSGRGQMNRAAKVCNINFKLNMPQGWSYTLVKTDIRGYLKLEANANATLGVLYSFRQKPRSLGVFKFSGPTEEDFLRSQNTTINDIEWSPCGGSQRMDILTNVIVETRDSARGFVAVDSANHQLQQKYTIQWQRCGQTVDPNAQGGDWNGRCRVVLETRFGKDMKDFWGQAAGPTQIKATEFAQQNGVLACEAQRKSNLLLKCTVDRGQCTATAKQ